METFYPQTQNQEVKDLLSIRPTKHSLLWSVWKPCLSVLSSN